MDKSIMTRARICYGLPNRHSLVALMQELTDEEQVSAKRARPILATPSTKLRACLVT